MSRILKKQRVQPLLKSEVALSGYFQVEGSDTDFLTSSGHELQDKAPPRVKDWSASQQS